MPNATTAMKPLYDRLKARGIERQYVKSAILPDWWDDALYADASTRLHAEMYIAKFLGVRAKDLQTGTASIRTTEGGIRLKRAKAAELHEVNGAVSAAIYAARITATLMADRLPFTGVRPALEIRNQLLGRPDCMWPDLVNLVDYCWQHGIGVIHVTRLPRVAGAKAIAGLATFIGDRPVIVLCSKRDSPAWLAFHLAHELGHIMCGHVKPGSGAVVDRTLDSSSDERDEREADRYAFQILTGDPDPKLDGPRMAGSALAGAVQSFGATHRIHPGTVALIYGYCKKRIPVAQQALKSMGEDHGAGAILASAFRKNTSLDDVSESIQRALSATTQVFGENTGSAA